MSYVTTKDYNYNNVCYNQHYSGFLPEAFSAFSHEISQIVGVRINRWYSGKIYARYYHSYKTSLNNLQCILLV